MAPKIINHGMTGPSLRPKTLHQVNSKTDTAIVMPGARVSLQIDPSFRVGTQIRSSANPGRTNKAMARSALKIRLLKLAGISIRD